MKRVFLGILWFFVFVMGVHAVHALTLDRTIRYTRVSFYSPNFPYILDGYKIAFVTDTHLMDDGQLMRIVDNLNEMDLDLLLLGGDFARRGGVWQRHLGILSETITGDGVFGVEGNHDHGGILREVAYNYGIGLLLNEGFHIQEGLFLAGVEDYWYGRPSFEDALKGALEDDFVLFLSHNPDATMSNDTTGIDLVLSGHTHGGQLTFFGLYAPALNPDRVTSYGQRFSHGFAYSYDGVPVFVSRGTGQVYPRVFSRPEVIILTLGFGEGVRYSVGLDFWNVIFWVIILCNLLFYFWVRFGMKNKENS